MSEEKCLSEEAVEVSGEEQGVHVTGSEFQSAMHEGKKDRSLPPVLHTAWRNVFLLAPKPNPVARTVEKVVLSGLTTSRK